MKLKNKKSLQLQVAKILITQRETTIKADRQLGPDMEEKDSLQDWVSEDCEAGQSPSWTVEP